MIGSDFLSMSSISVRRGVQSLSINARKRWNCGADGGFEIHIASRARAGNWLPTGGIERYSLMFRLYDTPVGVATRTKRDAPMPQIATVGCP